ncbi:uncharacterized protein LOC134185596 isoform X2 [Corticium candelabrum]|uniref:uncharacterized protein LOC134185596 isoform X2 n=1 Tax=Corticium candelabrum TaxID=121492 RepID=UPI002E260716|nr:uncharacterized protein LOC134185596 isoform X2 [Corticium candelabrum]
MLVSRCSRRMRLTNQLLRSSCSRPPTEVVFLDLSGKDLVALDSKLSQCSKLSTLLLKNNQLASTDGLDSCTELWRLDLACNTVKCLDGLARFVALGILELSCNNLDWLELRKIRHMHIISLHLQGNPKLDKDPHYRFHVIDIFPHLWMLDGSLITASERRRVDRFFRDTLNSSRPVHHKLGDQLFTPTSMKNLAVNGVFGEKTTHMMTRFPQNAVHNRDIDLRRLLYMGYSLQQEMILEAQHAQLLGKDVTAPPSFEMMLETRNNGHAEQCNMLLLLLVASVIYALPVDLLEETLEVARLMQIGPVECSQFLSLSPTNCCKAASLLLAAVSIDKDAGKNGGVYTGLYYALVQAISIMKRLLPKIVEKNSIPSKEINKNMSPEAQCILASEITQLLCLVPSFYTSADRQPGIMNLLYAATQDADIPTKIHSIMWRDGVELAVIQHQIATLLMQEMKDSAALFGSIKRQRGIVSSRRRPFSSSDIPLNTSTGRNTSLVRGSMSAIQTHNRSRRMMSRSPALGDHVLLSKEKLGRVVALPDAKVAVVQRLSGATSPAASLGDQDSFLYINVQKLIWEGAGFWRPTSQSTILNSPKQAWESQTLLFTQSQLSGALSSSAMSTVSPTKPAENALLDPCPPPSSPTGSTAAINENAADALSTAQSRQTIQVDLQSALDLDKTESVALLSAGPSVADIGGLEKNVTSTKVESSETTDESKHAHLEIDESTVEDAAAQTVDVNKEDFANNEKATNEVAEDVSSNVPVSVSSLYVPTQSVMLETDQFRQVITPELRHRLGSPVSKEMCNGNVVWMVGETTQRHTAPYIIKHMMFRSTKLLRRRQTGPEGRLFPASQQSHWVDTVARGSVAQHSGKGFQAAGLDRVWSVVSCTPPGLQAVGDEILSMKKIDPDPSRSKRQIAIDYSNFRRTNSYVKGRATSPRKLGTLSTAISGRHDRW